MKWCIFCCFLHEWVQKSPTNSSFSGAVWSIEQDESGEGGEANHADGVDMHEISTDERSGKKKDADDELPEVDARGGEVLGVAE